MSLKTIPWTNRSSRNRRRAVRTVKMIVPRCDSCSPLGGRWWENCPHDPYHTTEVTQVKTPVVETNDEGEEVVTGENVKNLYKRKPNVWDVPLSVRISAGLEVERALRMGCKFPPDVDPYPPNYDGVREYAGYAPMCEFRGCYEPHPKIKVSLPQVHEENPFVPRERTEGHFCTEVEAKIIAMKERGVTREVYDTRKAARQLQETNI